jgi:hypothetical protein
MTTTVSSGCEPHPFHLLLALTMRYSSLSLIARGGRSLAMYTNLYPSLFHLQLIACLSAVVLASFSCPASVPLCLGSFFEELNSSSVLGTFLRDHGTVIFQNGLLKNTTACPSMSVMYVSPSPKYSPVLLLIFVRFARGTAEPGELCSATTSFP